jgi:hypothetical protein
MENFNIIMEIITMHGNTLLWLVIKDKKVKLLEVVSETEKLLYDFDLEKMKQFFAGNITLSDLRGNECYIYDINTIQLNRCLDVKKYYIQDDYINWFTQHLKSNIEDIERVYNRHSIYPFLF